MSDVLKQVYNACDPYEPATAEYYCDCSEARGSSALMGEFQQHLALANDYLCFLCSGHIGGGKSSELEALKRALTDPHPPPPQARYFTVLLNISDYLDDYDAASTDILLAIVTELAATLRDEMGAELKDSYFVRRLNEIKRFFLSDVEINAGELPLWGAKAKVQRLKKDPTAREKVREVLLPQLSSMLAEINTVFDQARLEVRKAKVAAGEQPYTDIVLILDNMERIRKVAGFAEGLVSQRELFLERYTQLAGMQAHVIYTVPLRLVRSADGPQLVNRYGALFVLPMVKVIERGARLPFQSGMACLRALLQRRLNDQPLDQVFAPEALDFLLTYSGGNVRTLMTFVQNACSYADCTPIPLIAAHRAIQQAVRSYSTAIPEEHWTKLALLDRSPDQMIPGGDNDYLVMLENLSVLEYVNGGAGDPFTASEPWYAVNPIVRQLQKFKTAASELAKVSVP